MNTSHPPKLMSWLAGRANVELLRAEKLWQDAVAATGRAEEKKNQQEYWPALMACFQKLLENEAACISLAATSMRYWLGFSRGCWRVCVACYEVGVLSSIRAIQLMHMAVKP